MFDAAAVDLADRLFADAARRRDTHLGGSLSSLIATAVSKNATGNGRFHAALADLCADEFVARVDLLWDVLQQVLSAHGVVASGELAREMKEFLTPRIVRERDALAERARKEVSRFRGAAHLTSHVTERHRPIEDGLFARVDLLVKQLERPGSGTQPGGTVQHFYGSTVGVVQTGTGATANVQQSVVIGDAQATERALQALVEALSVSTQLGAASQKDVLGLVQDLAAEVRQAQPNRLKVGQLAAGLGVVVQSAASVKPAYELVRTAFLGWGIHLPIWP